MKAGISFAAAAALWVFLAAPVAADTGELTIEDLIAAHPVTGDHPHDFTWAPDGSRYLYAMPGAAEKDPPVLHIYDVRTKTDRVIASAKSDTRGSRSRELSQIVWSHDSRHIAFLDSGALFVAGADGKNERRLAGDADDPQWSPDDAQIGFVHANDLYRVGLRGGVPKRLTTDGSPTRINGDPDWLYSEELGVAHAFAWAPDGKSIAYLSFDESPITPFPIQDYAPLINTVEQQRYPVAGGKNPRVSLRTVPVTGGASRTIYDGGPKDEYLVPFTYAPDGALYAGITDRAQQHFRLLRFSTSGASGPGTQVLRESSHSFIEAHDAPQFIDKGRAFLWISDRDEVQALYRVDARTGTAKRITGSYPVVNVIRVDEKAGAADVLALYPHPTQQAVLRLALNGSGEPRNLTPEPGVHSAWMPRSGDVFIDEFSSLSRPRSITRRNIAGTLDETIFATPSLERFHLGTMKAVQVPSPDGPLDAVLVLPGGFDSAKTYPAIVQTYGGPLPPNPGSAADEWGAMALLLAQQGYVILRIDGPASSFARTANALRFREHMGEVAMIGPLAGAAWLKQQPFVDGARLGLSGWSYGGYLTAFTLTHSPQTFKSGIAGAPVTDWHFYDTAYTERYMGMPGAHAAAYDRTSVLPAVKDLQAKLLVIHGSSDDNVHLTNSMHLVSEAIKAQKLVEYFVFPGARHGPRGVAAQRVLYHMFFDWWKRTL